MTNLHKRVLETSERKVKRPQSDPWQDEQFLLQAELKSCEEQSRYEELSRRLTKIITGKK
jgi:hypothetical protein